MTFVCACGEIFDNVKDLRVHIALETEGWPLTRCSREHHDPFNLGDVQALRWGTIAGTYRYVALSDVPAYEAAGWRAVSALEQSYHGQWSTLMQYQGPDREHPMDPGHGH